MKPLRQILILALASSAGLMSCKKDTASPEADGLIGTWKLVRRDCYCVRGPVPDETIIFTARDFSIYRNGQLDASGTYGNTTAPVVCGSTNRVPVLQLAATQGYTLLAESAITDNSLVLNYNANGGGCLSDAPVDTYERQ